MPDRQEVTAAAVSCEVARRPFPHVAAFSRAHRFAPVHPRWEDALSYEAAPCRALDRRGVGWIPGGGSGSCLHARRACGTDCT